jgi:hypothetical protein
MTAVSSWLQTNMSSQDSTTWKAAIDGNFSVLSRLGVLFAPSAQSTPDMTVMLQAGHIFNGVTLTEVATQNSTAIAAPVSNPRIDRIVIDQLTGSVAVITGTPSSAPTAPAITAGACPVAQITINSTDAVITDSMIVDERDFTGLGRGSNTPPYGVSTNSGNNYSVTTSPSFTSRTTGRVIEVKINAANTGSATINPNSIGAITCKDNFGNNLTSGTLLANGTYQFVDDGTYLVLLNSTLAYQYLPFSPDTGSSNNYAVSPSPKITALSTGMTVFLIPGANNTSTGCTITVAGSTVPQAIKMPDGTNPPANAIVTTGVSQLVMNSSFFTLMNPQVTQSQVIVARGYDEFTGSSAITTNIPVDDTVPQSSEGDQICSVTMTPHSTSNRLRVSISGYGVTTTVVDGCIAVFNGGSNAIAAAALNNGVSGYGAPFSLLYEYIPGSTSSVTLTARAGAHTAGTLYLNNSVGGGGVRSFGGVGRTAMVVEEISV